MNYRLLFILLLSLSINVTFAQIEKRLALVIGNNEYSKQKLNNAVNDASCVAAKLKTLGFDVMLHKNTKLDSLAIVINDFTDKASDYEVVLFFYAGHAVQCKGINYLIPINNEGIKKENDIRFYSEDVNRLLTRLEESTCKLKIIILDACRNNPYSMERTLAYDGLALMNAPVGTLISFSTSPGCKAKDSFGSHNSPYTTAFLQILNKENLDLLNFFNEVGMLVSSNTDGEQIPWISNCPINGKFVFNKSIPSVINNNSVLSNNSDNSYILKSSHFDDNVDYVINQDTNSISKNSSNQELKNTQDILGPATIKIICDKLQKASVFLDGTYKGMSPIRITTSSGSHYIKVASKGYYPESLSLKLKPEEDKTLRFKLTKDMPDWFSYDFYSGAHHINYHFSPKYELGLSYMYRFDGSSFSLGAMLASSIGFFRGIDWSIVKVTSSVNMSTTSETKVDDGTGNFVDAIVTTSTINDSHSNKYTSEIDPYNQAKQHDANFLFLGNVGFNICNGLMLEAGFGGAYHQKRYYMSDTYIITKTIITNKQTGEIIGAPQYDYTSQGEDKWYSGYSKWSPALRLGARFFIPLDNFDDYSITLGGGYTYLPINHSFSSWDASIGFSWYF